MNIIDKKFVTGLLIGAVLGGIVMGFIDANRPIPLFSSANAGCGNWYQLREDIWDNIEEANRNGFNVEQRVYDMLGMVERGLEECERSLPIAD